MKVCIILNNMNVENERDENEAVDFDYEQIDEVNNPPIQVSREHANGFMVFIQSHQRIRDQEIHYQLQSDLINHLWQLHGESYKLQVCEFLLYFHMSYVCELLLNYIAKFSP